MVARVLGPEDVTEAGVGEGLEFTIVYKLSLNTSFSMVSVPFFIFSRQTLSSINFQSFAD